MESWSLWMATKEGQILANLNDTLGFEYMQVANGVGTFEIVMPPSFDDTLIYADNRIEIWREFAGASYLTFAGLVRGWIWKTDKAGATTLTIKGSCINHLLKRRILFRNYTT